MYTIIWWIGMILVQSSQNQTWLYPQLRFIGGFSTLASMASHSSLSTCGHCSPCLLIFWGRIPWICSNIWLNFPTGKSPPWGIDPRLGDFSGNRCLLRPPSSVVTRPRGERNCSKWWTVCTLEAPRVSGPDSMGRIASRQHRQGNPCCCSSQLWFGYLGASQLAGGLSSKFITELPSGYLT